VRKASNEYQDEVVNLDSELFRLVLVREEAARKFFLDEEEKVEVMESGEEE